MTLSEWSKPHHGNYCDHYATTTDGTRCERCGAERTVHETQNQRVLDVGLRQPPPVRMWCACGLRIDSLDSPDLISHAIFIHQQQPEHQAWREAAAERAPSFEVAVVPRP